MSVHAKKHWCITSYEDNFDSKIKSLIDGGILTYGVGQEEICPTTGRVHWQVYICCAKKLRLTTLKTHVGDSAHIEPMRGTSLQARDYCQKEESRKVNGRSFEEGVFPAREKKEASMLLEEASDIIRNGGSLKTIAETMPAVYIRHHRGLENFAKLMQPEPEFTYKPLTVWVLYGDAGSGKTRSVMNFITASGRKCYRKSYARNQPSWWDGYNGQSILLLDDFEGERSGCPIDEFLHLTDGYGHTRAWPVKGSFVYLDKVELIFITSNTAPDTWFTAPEKREAVLRRVPNAHYVRKGTPLHEIPLPEIHKYTEAKVDQVVPATPQSLAPDYQPLPSTQLPPIDLDFDEEPALTPTQLMTPPQRWSPKPPQMRFRRISAHQPRSLGKLNFDSDDDDIVVL